MAQASLYWDKEQYGAVQGVLSQASEFCSEHEVWRLNVAHTFFMQARRHFLFLREGFGAPLWRGAGRSLGGSLA